MIDLSPEQKRAFEELIAERVELIRQRDAKAASVAEQDAEWASEQRRAFEEDLRAELIRREMFPAYVDARNRPLIPTPEERAALAARRRAEFEVKLQEDLGKRQFWRGMTP